MQYDMVFEGGGAKGMVFVGALKELEERGHSPARLMGTSAGSIMATMLAAGYDANEMEEALNERVDDQPVFLGFLETPPALTREEIQKSAVREMMRNINVQFIPDIIEEKLDDAFTSALAGSKTTGRIFNFIERGGIYAADYFRKWLAEKLSSGIYPLERGKHGKGKPRSFGAMTLAEFYEATGAELTLIGADTVGYQTLYLNHNTAPDLPVVWAVRMSMSVPLLWHEVVWQEEWGKYRGKDVTGHTVVDGGMLSNFPIELYFSNLPHVMEVMGSKTTGATNVMGFLIDESMEVEGAPPAVSTQSKKFDFGKLKSVERILNLVNTMTQAHDKAVIEDFEPYVVRLPARGYGTVEFGMSDERRIALVNAGRAAAVQYFEEKAKAPGVLGMEDEEEALQSKADRLADRFLR